MMIKNISLYIVQYTNHHIINNYKYEIFMSI